MFNSFQVCWNFFFLTTGSSMACSSRVDVGNGVQIRWRENWAPYFLLAAGPRRMSVSCVALSLNCFQIGRWLIYFFSPPLLERIFFLFTTLCPLAKKKKKKTFAIFFFSGRQLFWGVSGSKMVKHMTKWTFIQCALLPFLPGRVEGFFLHHWATLACSCHWELLLSIKSWYCCGASPSPAVLSKIMGYSDD